MAPEVEFADPRTDPAPSGWSEFTRRLHPFWDYDLLSLEAWLSRNPPLLAVVREGRDVVGALSVLVCRTWRMGEFPPVTPQTRSVRPRWAEVFVPLFSGHHACVFAASLDHPARTAAIRAFERELVRYLGPGLLGVFYRAMSQDLVPAMTGPGRPHRVIDPVAVFDGSTVPTASSLDPGITVRSGFGRDDLAAGELTALLNRQRSDDDERAWAGGQRRRFGGLVHVDTRTRFSSAYLDRFTRRPDVDTMTYHASDGTLLAFNTMIDHPTRADMYHWAAVADHDGRLYADCCARRVRYVVEHGRRELSAGRGLLDVKGRMGFGTRELHTVAAPRPLLGR